ncbi:MAG: hypothetical protein F6K11_35190 [Leptolyngbya sp. SIO3F4]|nr:hypothetical protein [Leptolyngbya sp. SIO3F4]
MKVCILLTEKEARAKVADRIGAKVSRPTFYRWRNFLNLVQDYYTLDQIESLALFGGYVRKGLSMSKAFSACQYELEIGQHHG